MPESSDPINLEQQRKRAKDLLKSARAGDRDALARLSTDKTKTSELKLAAAQRVIAREAGFDSWAKLVKHLESIELRAASEAIQRGDASALRNLLRNSPTLRKRVNDPIGSFGSRPIHMAARHRDVLDVLIDFGADLNLRSDWENGPFTVLDSAPEDVARHLIARGAKLTPHAAARFGWMDELRKLADADPNIVHDRGGDGQQPLHVAKNVEVADFLLDRGAKIDERCIDHLSMPAQYALVDRPDVCRRLLDRGATPDIFMSARLGDLDLARRLIESNPASITARTFFGNYPLVPKMGIYAWTLGFLVSPHEIAIQCGHRDVFDLLMKNSPPRVRFIDGAMRVDETIARAAMADDPSIPASLSSDEQSLIALAAFHGRPDAALLMLALGFDPNARGAEGGSVLHAACWVGNLKLVDALLSRKVEVNLRDLTYGSTPLGWASFGSVMRRERTGDYVGVIQRLIAASADVKALGNREKSLIEMAEGNLKTQDALRKLGAS